MVDYESALRKPFTDAGKLIIGILLNLIPVVNWIALGFSLESSGLGEMKPSKKMPEWKNIGSLLVKGFISQLIGLVYAIPAIIVFLAGAGFAVTSLMNVYVGSIIPQEMISSVIAGTTSPEVVLELVMENIGLSIPTILSILPIFMLGICLALVASYMAPMAVLNYLKKKKLAEAFDVKSVWKLSFNMKYFKTWVVTFLVAFGLGMVFGWIPYLGRSIVGFIVGVITYSMFGEVYRELKGRR